MPFDPSQPFQMVGGGGTITPTLPKFDPGQSFQMAPQVPLQNVTAPLGGAGGEWTTEEPPKKIGDYIHPVVDAVTHPMDFLMSDKGVREVPLVPSPLKMVADILPEGKVKQGVTGLHEGLMDVQEAVTSPSSLAMLASGAGAEAVLPKLTRLGFSAWMGYEGWKGAKQTVESAKQGDVEGAVRSGVGTLASGAGAVLPLKGIVETEAIPRKIGPRGEEVSNIQVRQPGTLGGGMQKAVLRNQERGAVPRNIFTDYLTKEKDLRSGYTLDAPLVLLDPKVSGFASEGRPAPEQLIGRLENLSKQGKVSPVEVQVYKDAGLNEFLATRPTVKETAQWMQDNGPKVEVRKFGEGVVTDLEEKKRLSYMEKRNQATHELETMGHKFIDPGNIEVNGKPEPIALLLSGAVKNFSDKEYDALRRVHEADNQLLSLQRGDAQSDSLHSHWQSIAPKSEKDMPGYVEIAVTKPLSTDKSLREAAEQGKPQIKQGEQFPSTHSFPPNTLAFTRGYMETLPSGEKAFHVIEVQSDWAAKLREQKEKLEKDLGEEVRAGNPRAINNRDARQIYIDQQNDPLLHDYNRLALKAAIEHARSEGATKIIVQDAESAMMMEGHDRIGVNAPDRGEDRETQEEAEEDAERMFRASGVEHEAKEDGEGNWFASPSLIAKEPPQAKGMRLNYDTLLPRIAEELTGSKGEKVSLGEHKMAVEKVRPDIVDPITERIRTPGRTEPRKDLIFRNPDGTPKTDVSGLSFNLQPKGETPFSLFGKRTPKVEVEQESKPGGGLSTKTAEEKALSDKNNSREAFLKANKGKLPSSESGQVTIPPAVHDIVEKATDKLKGTTKQIGDFFKRGNLREVLTYTRDATDVQPKLYARQAKNHVLNNLQNVTTKDNLPMARKALTFVVEAKGQIKSLDDMRKTIVNSTKSSANKKEALSAIDYARQNWNSLQTVAKTYKAFTDRQIQNEQGAGFEVPSRQGYVHHAQDIDMDKGFFSSGEGEGTSFKKQRDYETYAESIAAGVKAKTIDSIDLLEHRLSVGQKMVAMREWVNSFRTVIDPTSKEPLIKSVEAVLRPGTTEIQYYNTPKGYSKVKEWIGGQKVAVKDGYEGVFAALTDPSWWSKAGTREAFLQANALAKTSRLLIDSYHIGKIGMWNAWARVTNLETPNPFSYRRGKTLLDYDIPTIQDLAKKGQIPKGWVNDLVEQKRKVDLGVSVGFNVGRITDSLHQDWVRNIPGPIGAVNKWLFDSLQRGAMNEIYLMEFDRVKEGSPGLSEEQVARRVVKDINTRFGSLGRQGIFKSRTAQDMMRLITLAPQWNEGLITSELKSLTQTGEFVGNRLGRLKDVLQGKEARAKIASGFLMRMVGGMVAANFAANQLINLYTRGYPTWDNKEEGIGAKLSAWIPDAGILGGQGKSKGFFLHPASVAAEVTHFITMKWEQSGSLGTALEDYAVNRKSSLAGLVSDIKKGDWNDAIPYPIPTTVITDAITQKEKFPGEQGRQAISSLGVKVDLVPSSQQRIQRLAREYNEKQGIVHKEEPVSDYLKLNNALRDNDMKEAQKQLDELKKTKPLATLIRYYAQEYPKELFTGKKERERAFEDSLSEDDKALYKQVKKEKEAIARKGLSLVRGPSRFSAFEEDKPQFDSSKPWEKYNQ